MVKPRPTNFNMPNYMTTQMNNSTLLILPALLFAIAILPEQTPQPQQARPRPDIQKHYPFPPLNEQQAAGVKILEMK